MPHLENTFTQLLKTQPYLLADGATGTNLFQAGLMTGDAPELWNIDEPDKIRAHYQAFADAGSDIILTNTFGGTRYRLMLHKAQDRVEELNIAAVKLLKEVVEKADKPIAIAGSIGPTGEILEPNGPVTNAEASAAFKEQAAALVSAGVDVLWLETMSSIEEVEAAVDGVAEFGLPIVFTMSVDTNGRTMMGITPEQIIHLSSNVSSKIHACGTNCGVGASEVVATVMTMKNASDDASPLLVAKANCGIPEWLDGEIVYNGTPELMANYVHLALDAGAKIVGGCCGTSYKHVAAMRVAMDNYQASNVLNMAKVESELGKISKGAMDLYLGIDNVAATLANKKSKRRRRA
ncbi:MAG: betaine--homocysteine S-methyltransferase [Arenicellales bacterium]